MTEGNDPMEGYSTHATIRAVGTAPTRTLRSLLPALVVTLLVLLGMVLTAPAAIAGPPDHAQASETARDAAGEQDRDPAGEQRDEQESTPASQDAEPAGQAPRGEGPAKHAPAHGTQPDPSPQQRGDDRGQGADASDDRGSAEVESREGATPNRGSLKVRSTGQETFPPATEPHPGCEFWLHFHGFDAGEREVRIYAWPPTGDRQLVHAGTVDLEQARGNDYSGIYPQGGPLTLEDLDAAADWPGDHEPHAQQGWHLRVEVEGPKHKMLWLDCPEARGETEPPSGDEPDAPTTGDPEPTVEDEPAAEDAEESEQSPVEQEDGATEPVEQPPLLIDDEEADAEEQVLGIVLESPLGVDGEVLGIGGAAPSDGEVAVADRGVEVQGQVLEADRALPVTGGALAWLAAIGLLASVLGARLITVGRGTA